MTGAGTVVYPNVALARVNLVPTQPTLIASVICLEGVEVIEENDGQFAATSLSAPAKGSCARTPVAVAALDVNGDKYDDALVFDPSCGNWIALGTEGGFGEGHDWDEVLPHLEASYFLCGLSNFDASGPKALLSLSYVGMNSLIETDGGTWKSGQWVAFPEPSLTERVTDVLVPLQGSGTYSSALVVQGYRTWSRLDLTDGGTFAVTRRYEPLVSPPYVLPPDGFDHLTRLPPNICDRAALGIGTTSSYAGSTPRTLQLIHWTDSTCSFNDILSDRQTVVTLATLPVGAELFVGIYERTESDAYTFILAEVTDCQTLSVLAAIPIEFDWRTPPTPGWGIVTTVPKTLGVEVAGFSVGNELHFVHYDGYDVRLVRAVFSSETWSLTEERHTIHTIRTDLSCE